MSEPSILEVVSDCVLTPSQRRAGATLERPRAIQPPMSQGNVVEGEVSHPRWSALLLQLRRTCCRTWGRYNGRCTNYDWVSR
jgi:hypothetical protein